MRPFVSILVSSALAATAMTIATPRDARADDLPSALGSANQVVLGDLIGFRTGAPGYLGSVGVPIGAGIGRASTLGGLSLGGLVGYGHWEGRSDDAERFTSSTDVLWVAPSFDVFVGRRVSLGASLGFSYARTAADAASWSADGSAYAISAMPRIGYAVPLDHGFSLWPRLGIGYTYTQASSTATGDFPFGPSEFTVSSWIGGADLGLIFQATPSVFVTARPELTIAYDTVSSEPRGSAFKVGMGDAIGLGIIL